MAKKKDQEVTGQTESEASVSDNQTVEPEKKVSKRKAIRVAIEDKGLEDTQQIIDFVKTTYGHDIEAAYISTTKSQLKSKKAGVGESRSSTKKASIADLVQVAKQLKDALGVLEAKRLIDVV